MPEPVQAIPVEKTSEYPKATDQNDDQTLPPQMLSCSSDEVIVGKWVNGNHIYKKTVYRESNTSLKNGSGVLDYSIFGSVDYVDEICMQQVSLLSDFGYITFNSGFSNRNHSFVLNIWYTTEDTLYYESNGVSSVENLTITLYYTKQKE
jgi:hypothetical protein